MSNLRIATAAVKGTLQQHPLVQGLTLSALDMVEKEDRGIFTLAGRPTNHSETERMLMADAALQLALLSGNKTLARKLGIAATKLKMSLDDLFSLNLPSPGLALSFPDVLTQNFIIIDQRMELQPGAPKSGWASEILAPYKSSFNQQHLVEHGGDMRGHFVAHGLSKRFQEYQ